MFRIMGQLIGHSGCMDMGLKHWLINDAFYFLAKKVSEGGEIELKSEEISKIKEKIGKYMGALIVGQVWDALEGVPSGEDKQKK